MMVPINILADASLSHLESRTKSGVWYYKCVWKQLELNMRFWNAHIPKICPILKQLLAWNIWYANLLNFPLSPIWLKVDYGLVARPSLYRTLIKMHQKRCCAVLCVCVVWRVFCVFVRRNKRAVRGHAWTQLSHYIMHVRDGCIGVLVSMNASLPTATASGQNQQQKQQQCQTPGAESLD